MMNSKSLLSRLVGWLGQQLYKGTMWMQERNCFWEPLWQPVSYNSKLKRLVVSGGLQ
jgi:hypothetical protein